MSSSFRLSSCRSVNAKPLIFSLIPFIMKFTHTIALLVLATVALGQVQKPCTGNVTGECTSKQYCNTSGGNECEALLKFGDTCIKNEWCISKWCLDTNKCSKDPKPLFSTGAIAGLAAGGVALLVIIVVIVFCVIKKKRGNKNADPEI